MKLSLLFATFAACLVPSVCFAQTSPGDAQPNEQRDDAEPGHSVSLTFAPLRLILPEVQLMAEFKLDPKISVAAIGGYGQVTPVVSGGPANVSPVTIWEAGGQFRYYPIGTFEHGMQIGAQAEYIGGSASSSSGNVQAFATGGGLFMGPFIGYKLATHVGFTLDLQGGVGYLVATASGNSSDGSTATASTSTLAPILNVNVGWSF